MDDLIREFAAENFEQKLHIAGFFKENSLVIVGFVVPLF